MFKIPIVVPSCMGERSVTWLQLIIHESAILVSYQLMYNLVQTNAHKRLYWRSITHLHIR